MRITVRLPDDLGENVKRRTDNVSAYVTDALTEKIEREERRRARRELLDMAGEGSVAAPKTDRETRPLSSFRTSRGREKANRF